MIIRNLTSPRKDSAVANQVVITTKNQGTFFQSYESVVAKVSKKGQVYLSADWDYSRTTMKYLYQFLGGFGWNDLSASKVRKYIKDGTFKYQKELKV